MKNTNKHATHRRRSIIALGCAALMAASLVALPLTALAAARGTQTWKTDAAGNGSWTNPNGGEIDLSYQTNGDWTDPDGNTHAAGTYIVKIPTTIAYTGMHVGAVATTDDYSVLVAGVLPAGKSVKVLATSGAAVAGTGLSGTITETTSLKDANTVGTVGEYASGNFRTFSAAQCAAGGVAATGVVAGTTVVDNIAMNGTAYSAGTYTGTVTYTASLI